MGYPVGPFLRLRDRGEPPVYEQDESEEQQSNEPEEEDEQ